MGAGGSVTKDTGEVLTNRPDRADSFDVGPISFGKKNNDQR